MARGDPPSFRAARRAELQRSQAAMCATRSFTDMPSGRTRSLTAHGGTARTAMSQVRRASASSASRAARGSSVATIRPLPRRLAYLFVREQPIRRFGGGHDAADPLFGGLDAMPLEPEHDIRLAA